MGFDLFDYSVNVIGFIKNDLKYGLTVAWGMQVDYKKVVFLIGEQSQTGKVIEVGDLIGVSVLSKSQKEIGLKFGTTHSEEVDKYNNVSYTCLDNALVINDASVIMKVKVKEIIRLKDIEEDLLIYCEVITSEKNNSSYLHTSDFE